MFVHPLVHQMSSRGGARRVKVEPIDVGKLTTFITEWCIAQGNKKALFFGPYECIGNSQATSAEGLAFNAKFLQGLLASSPSGYVVPTTLRSILVGLAQRRPGLQSGISDLVLWAGSRCDVIMTVLGHLRRLRKEKERLIVKSKLDPSEYMELHKCLMIISNNPELAADSGSDASTHYYPEQQEDSQEGAESQGAVDSQEDIMDADGWPACLNAACDDDDDDDDDPGRYELDDEHGDDEGNVIETPAKKVRSQPSSSRKNAKHGLEPSSPEDKLDIQSKTPKGAKVTVTKSSKAAKDDKPKNAVVSKSFGLIKLGCYSNQSYIQMKVESGWKLVVAVSSKQSADREMIAKMLFLQALGPDLTKASMLDARAALLANT